MAIKTYVDENGYELYDYETEFIEHYRTGHIFHDDYCGTCDGGGCGNCREIWMVGTMGCSERVPWPHPTSFEVFEDEASAMEAFLALQRESERTV